MVMGQLWNAVKRDVQSLKHLGSSIPQQVPPGLLTYPYQRVDGGEGRLHLRVQEDQSGLIFRDVTDVLHLSPPALRFMYLVLEGVDEGRAVSCLSREYQGSNAKQIAADFRKMKTVVDELRSPNGSCATCAIDLPYTQLFSTRAQAPHKVDAALTYACNNRCPHCYNDPDRFDMRALKVDEWKRILDKLAEVGVPQIIFTGGEATVYKGLVELIRHANQLGQIVGLNSNGRRLADQRLTDSYAEAGLNHIQITLESHRADAHDAMVGARAFDECVAGVKAVMNTDMHVITNSTITRVNAFDIDETVEFLHDLGLGTFAMNGMIYSGGGDQNPDALLPAELPPVLMNVKSTADRLGMRFLWYTVTEYCEMNPVELEIGAKRCNAGEYSMCVEPNGDVLPCQSFYTSAGNMLTDDWSTIWKGELFRSFRDREGDPVWAGLPEKCHDCLDLPLCGGGCRIERESKEGTAPGGCQSCASGNGLSKSATLEPKKMGVRSSGLSAAEAAKSCGCAPPLENPAGLVQLRTRPKVLV